MIVPRAYQTRAVESLRRHIRLGRRRVVLAAATGCGKTVIAAMIIQSTLEKGGRALFLAHRKELLDQCASQLLKLGVTDIGIIRASEKTNPSAKVQVASLMTLAHRDLPEADVILVDEAHRAQGDTYVRILNSYPEAQIIGLTASPARMDGRPLADSFDALEQAASYGELIAAKHIVAPRVMGVRDPVDLSDVHTRQGDYALDELEGKMTAVVGDIVAEWVKHAEGRRTAIFACTIAHSQAIVERFMAAGVRRIEHLDGNTSEPEREAILGRLERGETLIVSNVDVLSEGWDCPPVKCIVSARPTKSLVKWMQTSGRILRPWQNVQPLILDHAGNVGRHGLPHEDRIWSLTEGPRPLEKSPYRTCPACFTYVKEIPCEQCGHQPEVKPRVIREDRSVKLESVEGQDQRRGHFLRLVEKARAYGYRPGYAGALYKEKYSQWPPWSWSQEAKSAYAQDHGWQYRQNKRENEKKFFRAEEEEESGGETTPDDWLGGWGR